jgi:transcriptional regulator with XRE-family HTH domain
MAGNSTTRIKLTANYLRALRDKAGLSLEALAARTGERSGTLSKYERGTLAIPVRTLVNLAAALGDRPERVVAECLLLANPELANTAFGGFLANLAPQT